MSVVRCRKTVAKVLFKTFGMEFTAAGTVPDSHRIPFYQNFRIKVSIPKSVAKVQCFLIQIKFFNSLFINAQTNLISKSK